MPLPGAQPLVERGDARQHRPHRGDRVDADVRPRSVRRSPFRHDLERDEPLVRDRDDLLGRLRHDRRIGRRPADEVLRADAADLLVGDGGDDDVAAQAVARRGSADEHDRGERPLHVAGAAAVQAAVLHAPG